jgi:hypothetical protein
MAIGLAPEELIIPLVAGVDTYPDERVIEAPQLLDLRNADLGKPGGIRKRTGYHALPIGPSTIDAGGHAATGVTMETRVRMLSQIDGQLLAYAGGAELKRLGAGVFSGEVRNALAADGGYLNGRGCVTRTHPIEPDYTDSVSWRSVTDCVEVGSYLVMLFGRRFIRVLDKGTLEVIASHDPWASSVDDIALHLTVTPDGSRLYLFAKRPGGTAQLHLYHTPLTIAAGGTVDGPFNAWTSVLLQAVGGSGPYDRVDTWPVSGTQVMAAWSELSSVTGFGFVTTSGLTSAGSVSGGDTGSGRALRVWQAGSQYILMRGPASGTNRGLRRTVLNSSLGTVTADEAVDTTSHEVRNMALGAMPDSTHCVVYYTLRDPLALTSPIVLKSASSSGTTLHTIGYGLVPVADTVSTADGGSYLPCLHPHDTESVFLLLYNRAFNVAGRSAIGRIVGKWAPRIAGAVPEGGRVRMLSLGGGKYLWAGQLKKKVHGDPAAGFTFQYQPALCEVDLSEAAIHKTAQLGPQVHVGASVVGADSLGAELGFLVPPRIVSVVQAGSAGMAAGDHVLVAVYEHYDAHGQLHRSAPSDPFTVTLGIDRATLTANVTTPLLLSAKRATIALYRRSPTSSAFHRTSLTTVATTPVRAVRDYLGAPTQTHAVVDASADANLDVNEILYTDGDILPNYPPPPTRYVERHGTRLWCISDDDGSLWFSKEHVRGEGVAFHPALVMDVGGRPIALASRETDLAVFWSDKVGVIYGDGPNDQGVGGQFTPPLIVPGDLQGVNPRSIVTTPEGVMFADATGIKLLSRDNQIVPIGTPVRGFAADTIVAADLIPNAEEVRFTAREKRVLCYQYLIKQWHVHDIVTSATAINHALYLGGQHLLALDGVYAILAQQAAAHDDAGQYVQTQLTTPWVKTAGLVGSQRVWSVSILGRYRGAHDLRVEVGYDYASAFVQTATFTDATLSTLTPYEVDVGLVRQVCEAFRLRITILQSGSANSAGADLHALRVHFGRRRDGRRKELPSQARR